MIKMVSETLWNKLGKLTKMDGVLIGLLAIGLVVSGISLFRGITKDNQVQVEYLDATRSGLSDRELIKKLVVDIEGAVFSPGVYELSGGSRIKDVLIAAGGFTEKAQPYIL